jgi:parallel beta-helix repeat protein
MKFRLMIAIAFVFAIAFAVAPPASISNVMLNGGSPGGLFKQGANTVSFDLFQSDPIVPGPYTCGLYLNSAGAPAAVSSCAKNAGCSIGFTIPNGCSYGWQVKCNATYNITTITINVTTNKTTNKTTNTTIVNVTYYINSGASPVFSSGLKVTACGVSQINTSCVIAIASNLASSGTCFSVAADSGSLVFDCGGRSITGNGGGNGIEVLSGNVVVQNCVISNFQSGIAQGGGTLYAAANTLSSNSMAGISQSGGIMTADTNTISTPNIGIYILSNSGTTQLIRNFITASPAANGIVSYASMDSSDDTVNGGQYSFITGGAQTQISGATMSNPSQAFIYAIGGKTDLVGWSSFSGKPQYSLYAAGGSIKGSGLFLGATTSYLMAAGGTINLTGTSFNGPVSSYPLYAQGGIIDLKNSGPLSVAGAPTYIYSSGGTVILDSVQFSGAVPDPFIIRSGSLLDMRNMQMSATARGMAPEGSELRLNNVIMTTPAGATAHIYAKSSTIKAANCQFVGATPPYALLFDTSSGSINTTTFTGGTVNHIFAAAGGPIRLRDCDFTGTAPPLPVQSVASTLNISNGSMSAGSPINFANATGGMLAMDGVRLSGTATIGFRAAGATLYLFNMAVPSTLSHVNSSGSLIVADKMNFTQAGAIVNAIAISGGSAQINNSKIEGGSINYVLAYGAPVTLERVRFYGGSPNVAINSTAALSTSRVSNCTVSGSRYYYIWANRSPFDISETQFGGNPMPPTGIYLAGCTPMNRLSGGAMNISVPGPNYVVADNSPISINGTAFSGNPEVAINLSYSPGSSVSFVRLNATASCIHAFASSVTITNCTLWGNPEVAVNLTNSSTSTLIGNVINRSMHMGVRAVATTFVMSNNLLLNAGNSSVNATNSLNCIIGPNNRIYNSEYGVQAVNSTSMQVSGNAFENDSLSIWLQSSARCVVELNSIRNGSWAVFVNSSPLAAVKGNTLVSNTFGGAVFLNSPGSNATNNSVTSSLIGIDARLSPQALISGNTLNGNPYGILVQNSSAAVVSLNKVFNPYQNTSYPVTAQSAYYEIFQQALEGPTDGALNASGISYLQPFSLAALFSNDVYVLRNSLSGTPALGLAEGMYGSCIVASGEGNLTIEKNNISGCVLGLAMDNMNNSMFFDNIFMDVVDGRCDDCEGVIGNVEITGAPNILGCDAVSGNAWLGKDGDGLSDTCLNLDGDCFCDYDDKTFGGVTDSNPLAVIRGYQFTPVIDGVNGLQPKSVDDFTAMQYVAATKSNSVSITVSVSTGMRAQYSCALTVRGYTNPSFSYTFPSKSVDFLQTLSFGPATFSQGCYYARATCNQAGSVTTYDSEDGFFCVDTTAPTAQFGTWTSYKEYVVNPRDKESLNRSYLALSIPTLDATNTYVAKCNIDLWNKSGSTYTYMGNMSFEPTRGPIGSQQYCNASWKLGNGVYKYRLTVYDAADNQFSLDDPLAAAPAQGGAESWISLSAAGAARAAPAAEKIALGDRTVVVNGTGTGCAACENLTDFDQAQIIPYLNQKATTISVSLFYENKSNQQRVDVAGAPIVVVIRNNTFMEVRKIVTNPALSTKQAVFNYQPWSTTPMEYTFIYCCFYEDCGFEYCMNASGVKSDYLAKQGIFQMSDIQAIGTQPAITMDKHYFMPAVESLDVSPPECSNPNDIMCKVMEYQSNICVPIALLGGFMLASLYYSGRNPFAMLDFTQLRVGRHINYSARGVQTGGKVSAGTVASVAKSIGSTAVASAKGSKGSGDSKGAKGAAKGVVSGIKGKGVTLGKISFTGMIKTQLKSDFGSAFNVRQMFRKPADGAPKRTTGQLFKNIVSVVVGRDIGAMNAKAQIKDQQKRNIAISPELARQGIGTGIGGQGLIGLLGFTGVRGAAVANLASHIVQSSMAAQDLLQSRRERVNEQESTGRKAALMFLHTAMLFAGVDKIQGMVGMFKASAEYRSILKAEKAKAGTVEGGKGAPNQFSVVEERTKAVAKLDTRLSQGIKADGSDLKGREVPVSKEDGKKTTIVVFPIERVPGDSARMVATAKANAQNISAEQRGNAVVTLRRDKALEDIGIPKGVLEKIKPGTTPEMLKGLKAALSKTDLSAKEQGAVVAVLKERLGNIDHLDASNSRQITSLEKQLMQIDAKFDKAAAAYNAKVDQRKEEFVAAVGAFDKETAYSSKSEKKISSGMEGNESKENILAAAKSKVADAQETARTNAVATLAKAEELSGIDIPKGVLEKVQPGTTASMMDELRQGLAGTSMPKEKQEAVAAELEKRLNNNDLLGMENMSKIAALEKQLGRIDEKYGVAPRDSTYVPQGRLDTAIIAKKEQDRTDAMGNLNSHLSEGIKPTGNESSEDLVKAVVLNAKEASAEMRHNAVETLQIVDAFKDIPKSALDIKPGTTAEMLKDFQSELAKSGMPEEKQAAAVSELQTRLKGVDTLDAANAREAASFDKRLGQIDDKYSKVMSIYQTEQSFKDMPWYRFAVNSLESFAASSFLGRDVGEERMHTTDPEDAKEKALKLAGSGSTDGEISPYVRDAYLNAATADPKKAREGYLESIENKYGAETRQQVEKALKDAEKYGENVNLMNSDLKDLSKDFKAAKLDMGDSFAHTLAYVNTNGVSYRDALSSGINAKLDNYLAAANREIEGMQPELAAMEPKQREAVIAKTYAQAFDSAKMDADHTLFRVKADDAMSGFISSIANLDSKARADILTSKDEKDMSSRLASAGITDPNAIAGGSAYLGFMADAASESLAARGMPAKLAGEVASGEKTLQKAIAEQMGRQEAASGSNAAYDLLAKAAVYVEKVDNIHPEEWVKKGLTELPGLSAEDQKEFVDVAKLSNSGKGISGKWSYKGQAVEWANAAGETGDPQFARLRDTVNEHFFAQKAMEYVEKNMYKPDSVAVTQLPEQQTVKDSAQNAAADEMRQITRVTFDSPSQVTSAIFESRPDGTSVYENNNERETVHITQSPSKDGGRELRITVNEEGDTTPKLDMGVSITPDSGGKFEIKPLGGKMGNSPVDAAKYMAQAQAVLGTGVNGNYSNSMEIVDRLDKEKGTKEAVNITIGGLISTFDSAEKYAKAATEHSEEGKKMPNYSAFVTKLGLDKSLNLPSGR